MIKDKRVHFIHFHCLFCFSFAESDGRHRTEDREAGFLSDPEDDLTDFHKTSKHSEVYSATVPSIDSAMSSWDSSGFDAGYGSQGEVNCSCSLCLKTSHILCRLK